MVLLIWRLLLSALTRHGRWDFPSSLACVTGILYTEWSSPTSLLAGLLVCLALEFPYQHQRAILWRLFCVKFPATFFSCLFCYARCVHWPPPGRTDERKVSSTILLSSFQMNKRTASCLISPHQFYARCSPTLHLVLFYDMPPLTMVTQQVHLHGQWLGKRQHGCLPTWWVFVYLLRCISVCFLLYKFEHFWAEEYFKYIPGRTARRYKEIFIYPW